MVQALLLMLEWQDHIQVADKNFHVSQFLYDLVIVQALLLTLEWQDHIQVADKNFHVSWFLYDLAISG